MMKRSSGILMHLSSLPSPYGIGTMGEEARKFVQFLKQSGQSYWQVLPIGPTSYGDSPYQSFSVFAGNPYFIDLDTLCNEGLLARKSCSAADWGSDTGHVDYESLAKSRLPLLEEAFKTREKLEFEQEEFHKYRKKNSHWLDDYGLYMAIKETMGQRAWNYWDEDLRLRKPKAIADARKALSARIDFYIWLQFKFFQQWNALRSYANLNGVKLIGDIPIYVAADSADTWANTYLFDYDEENCPNEVAGCPPDYFCATGQLWGNPLYRWDVMKKEGYRWWIARISAMTQLFDVTRIDHFRGFESYYAIPAAHKTAEHGHWKKGPGIGLFTAIKKELGNISLIAEDLGFITPEVIKLRESTGYPGMKILQFAFNPESESDYLPHNVSQNCVMYTGTHDNNTARGWIHDVSYAEFRNACEYLNCQDTYYFNWDLIRGAWGSVSNLAVAQMQDFLNLPSWSRMNTPSTLGGNWQWRVLSGELSPELAKRIHYITKLYGRLEKHKKGIHATVKK